MTIHKITKHLFQIDLDQNLTGFSSFINAWLYQGEGLTFVVDPGPKASIEILVKHLSQLGISRLDYILLTHIHIDHAGGTGRLIEVFPEAKVVCHPKGIPHLVDPEKLWQGSLKVLGPIAEAYGEILPVSENAFLQAELIETNAGDITIIETPGHAVHHQSFLFQKTLFAGEVAGFVTQTPDGMYQRPATPPKFMLEISVESLEKLRKIRFERFCSGHYGSFSDPREILDRARLQLPLWVDIVKETWNASGSKNLNQRVITRLLAEDSLFAAYQGLSEDLLERENYFIGNTIKGMLEYIKSGQS